MGEVIKICSLNTNGISSPLKRFRLQKKLISEHIQIFCAVETHKKKDDRKEILPKAVWNNVFESRGTGKARGVAVFVHRNLDAEPIETINDREGRMVAVKLKIKGKIITIAAIYAPNKGQVKFLRRVFKRIDEFFQGDLFIAGDLNYDLNKNKDVDLRQWRLQDIYKEVKGKSDPTFFSKRHKSFSCIDYFLQKEENTTQIKSVRIDPIWISDHAPIVVELSVGNEKKLGRWRFNANILKSEEDQEKCKQEVKFYFQENKGTADPQTVWDAFKAVMRGTLMGREYAFKKRVKEKREVILKDILNLQIQLQKKYDRENAGKLKEKRNQLEGLDGLMMWKRDLLVKNEYARVGIKTMRRLARYLKKKNERQRIKMIRAKDGANLYKDAEIRNRFLQFYKELFKKTEVVKLKEKMQLQIEQQDLDWLNAVISENEIIEVIKNLKQGKSPGLDGFSAEFYKLFQQEVIEHMREIFNLIMSDKKVPDTWKRSEILVLYKEGKPRDEVTGYRPISLTNTDYKIFMKVLANRLEKILPKLVQEDQHGFIKGRTIGDPIRNILNILQCNKYNKKSVALLKLDVYKAFDTISHGYMLSIMDAFGIKGNFLKGIKTVYEGIEATLRINNGYSEVFKIGRGIRQGCPLSPLIFALAMEYLAENIRKNTNIEGFRIGKEELKLNLFADDIIMVITQPQKSIKSVLEELQRFEDISGLSINMKKSDMLFYNISPKIQREVAAVTGIKLGVKKFKYLGIQLTKNIDKVAQVNVNIIWRKIQRKIREWKDKRLGIMGKIRALKMIIIPKLLYLFQVLPVEIPARSLNKWTRSLVQWVFGKPKARMRRGVLHLPLEEAGWAIPDIKLYYEAFQIKKLCTISRNPQKKWVKLENEINSNLGNNGVFQVGYKKLIKNLVGPRRTTFICWRTWAGRIKQNIWKRTPLLSLQGIQNLDPQFIKYLKGKGILFLVDLLKSGGTPLPELKIRELLGDKYWLYGKMLFDIIKDLRWEGYTEFEKIYEEGEKGEAGKIYKLLIKQEGELEERMTKLWGKDIEFTEDDYKNIRTNLKKTKLESYRELQRKFIWKWYKCPDQLAHYVPNCSPNCWHGCRVKGTYLHLWWYCPKVNLFWLKVEQKLSEILGVKINLNVKALFRGNIENLKGGEEIVRAGIIAAKATIALGWKDSKKICINTWNKYLFKWVQSELIYIMKQAEPWGGKVNKFMFAWDKYKKWVMGDKANRDIRKEFEKSSTWLNIF